MYLHINSFVLVIIFDGYVWAADKLFLGLQEAPLRRKTWVIGTHFFFSIEVH